MLLRVTADPEQAYIQQFVSSSLYAKLPPCATTMSWRFESITASPAVSSSLPREPKKGESMSSPLVSTRNLYHRFTSSLTAFEGIGPLLLRLYLAPIMIQEHLDVAME